MQVTSSCKDALKFVVLLSPLVLIVLCCAGFVLNMGPEQIARLNLSSNLQANVYAEGSAHFEPPGYLSVEVVDDSSIKVPRYSFFAVGSQRVPSEPLTSRTTSDLRYAGITKYDDAIFMIDLQTYEYWPPRNWSYDDFSPEIASRMLAELRKEFPLTTCTRCDELLEMKANRAKNEPN